MGEEWQIEGKHFLVTGGASGLGAGNVRELLDNGAKFVAILDINEEAGKSISDLYNKTYPDQTIFVKCDVANEQSLTRGFNQVLAKLKRIDAVINNAGIVNDSLDQWSSSVDVNLKGLISLTLKGISHMRKDTGGAGGTIINVSSVAAFLGVPGIPVYSTTKSAVLQFGRCVSSGDLYEKNGVRIMTICYGATDTSMLRDIKKFPCDEQSGKKLHEFLCSMTLQKVDSAAKGIISMLKNGENGSIWLSQHNEAAKDITSVVDAAFEQICKTLNIYYI